MHSSKRIDNEPRIHRLDRHPRVHRIDHINRSYLSDCCGAPIIQGGICFECHENCEEADGDQRPYNSFVEETVEAMVGTHAMASP
jgi:hypothetical protein